MDSDKKGNTKYQVGQQVVYPMQGVGAIQEIVEKQFKGQPTPYYVIYLGGTDMTVMIPCEKVDDLGIRSVVSEEVANEALKNLEKPAEPAISDWKQRYQNNIDLLKSGSVTDIAIVVASLYFRSKQKELPILERKLFDNAKKLLIDELALALDKSLDDIEDIIFSKLEQASLAAKTATKAAEDQGSDLTELEEDE